MRRGLLSALSIVCAAHWQPPYIASENSNDPYKPRPRSKGEKARNKRYRK